MPIASKQRQQADDLAISLENVAVRYRVPRERVSGIKEFTIRWLQRRMAYQDFWALQDVSFQIKRGETFGVIGRNGSGKSTLLKVIARVLYPTRGRLILQGRVAPLLELGAAFHPELTGRENVYLNSALLGRTRKEVDRLFTEIVDFAEISDFIDAPIRTYSTGMVTRLGFAVATCIRPDILLVDEVLSVGDAAFQQKCLERMYAFQEQGTTILLVSHSMATIEAFCERALWLQNGDVQALGSASEVAQRYTEASRHSGETGELDTPREVVPVLPTLLADPLPSANGDFVLLPEVERVYPAEPALNIRQGTIFLWLKFISKQEQRTAILFHSDDSRYVLYTCLDESHPGWPVRQLVARAGGNRRALDPFYGQANFPEVVITLGVSGSGNVPFPDDEWHLVTMTWLGYPDGFVRLYVDGALVGETSYDRRHDNRYRLPLQMAVGLRPREWVGELVQSEDGKIVDLRPQATLQISAGGVALREVRLYPRALTEADIQVLQQETVPEAG